MDEILRELALLHCKELFEEHKVGPKEVLTLTDAEFEKLGVLTVWDRARLRNRCRTIVQLPDSPTLRKLRELSSHRNIQRKQFGRSNNISTTRRVHVGWMIKKKRNSVYSRVTGGKEVIDIHKSTTLAEMKEKFLEIYFPNGENKIQGLQLKDYNYYIGNYAGAPIQDTLSNGDPFTLEGYYNEIRTYPIRLYLFTSAIISPGADEDSIIIKKQSGEPQKKIKLANEKVLQLPNAYKYMSSDEEGDDGYVSHSYSWESEEIQKIKDSLDKKYLDTCPPRSKRHLSKRSRGSIRQQDPPKLASSHDWVLNIDS